MNIEYIFLGMYFLFLLGLMSLANNVQVVANHPMTERLVNKFRYNLRELPRVDYKELSDDDDVSEDIRADESEEESEEVTLRRRRETNPIGRTLEEALD